MNHMTKVRLIQNLSEEELKRGIRPEGSWHQKVFSIKQKQYQNIFKAFYYKITFVEIYFNVQYKDSAYIYIGGFPYDISEGDLIIVFSQ